MEEKVKILDFQPSPYQYSYVDLPTVIENPNEYIIPGCLPACQELWSKNIETFMCSNLDDNYFYVLLMDLSSDNMKRFQDLMNVDTRYFYSFDRDAYGIRVSGTSVRDKLMLTQLASVFQIQDVLPIRYQSEEEFLMEYKTIGGGYDIDPVTYSLIPKVNSERINTTFEEALIRSEKEHLYDSDDHRVYKNPLFLSWHQRYIDSQKNSKYNR